MARSAAERPFTPAQQRVNELLQRLFAGNESAMAKALGCSQAAISHIVHGHRGVGSRILRSIAALPGVSPDWALLGVGAPPATKFQRDPTKCFLPVFSSIDFALAVDPVKAPTSRGEQVTPADYSETRIIFEIPEADTWLRHSGGRLQPGDLLLLETDRQVWCGDLKFLDGRICLVTTLTEQRTKRAELVRVDLKDVQGEGPNAILTVREQILCQRDEAGQLEMDQAVQARNKKFVDEHGRPPRQIVANDWPPSRRRRKSRSESQNRIKAVQIIAVAIRLMGVP